jgi:hypothetical protein
MAERMSAPTEHVDSSHTAFIAQPSIAAALIAKDSLRRPPLVDY